MAYYFHKDNAISQVFLTHFVVILKSSFSKFEQVNLIGFIVQVEKSTILKKYISIKVHLGRKHMKESEPVNFK